QRFGFLQQRRRLLAELLVSSLLLRLLVGERGVPPVETGSTVMMRDQRLLIIPDWILVAHAEPGIDRRGLANVLASRADHHQIGQKTNRLLGLHRRRRIA